MITEAGRIFSENHQAANTKVGNNETPAGKHHVTTQCWRMQFNDH